jgi:hypothetical protein
MLRAVPFPPQVIQRPWNLDILTCATLIEPSFYQLQAPVVCDPSGATMGRQRPPLPCGGVQREPVRLRNGRHSGLDVWDGVHADNATLRPRHQVVCIDHLYPVFDGGLRTAGEPCGLCRFGAWRSAAQQGRVRADRRTARRPTRPAQQEGPCPQCPGASRRPHRRRPGARVARASFYARRRVVETLIARVTLLPTGRGCRRFDPSSVRIDWTF